MNKKMIIMVSLLALSMVTVGCGKNKNENAEKKEVTVEDNRGETEEDIAFLEDVELSMGEKAKVSPEDIENLYEEDKDMILRFNDFVGKKAPDFEMTKLDGEKVNLSDLKGEDVILEFMGTWCPACIDTLETNESFNKNSKDVQILGLAVQDTVESIEEMKKTHNIQSSKYALVDEKVAEKYDLIFVPMYVYVDKEGYVQMILAGDSPLEMIEEYAAKSFN